MEHAIKLISFVFTEKDSKESKTLLKNEELLFNGILQYHLNMHLYVYEYTESNKCLFDSIVQDTQGVIHKSTMTVECTEVGAAINKLHYRLVSALSFLIEGKAPDLDVLITAAELAQQIHYIMNKESSEKEEGKKKMSEKDFEEIMKSVLSDIFKGGNSDD